MNTAILDIKVTEDGTSKYINYNEWDEEIKDEIYNIELDGYHYVEDEKHGSVESGYTHRITMHKD